MTIELENPGPALEQTAGFALLFYSNPLPMWVFDNESLRMLDVNEAAVRRPLGLGPSQGSRQLRVTRCAYVPLPLEKVTEYG